MADDQYPYSSGEWTQTGQGQQTAQGSQGVEPTSQQPATQASQGAQPTAQQPVAQDGYSAQPSGQQAYGAAQQPQATQRQPWPGGYVPQQQSQSFGYASAQQPRQGYGYTGQAQRSSYGQPPRPDAAATARAAAHREAVSRGRRQRVGLKAALAGFVGGALGALAVVMALRAAGIIGTSERVVVQEASGSSTPITITASDDVTVAQAVAAKALPSVVSVHVTAANGSGLGSGVILDTSGNILTNYHVAGDAETISVTIGGKSYDATLVGGDASSDLAVIHAELGTDVVTPIERGDSDALAVGDWVMTIGSPFGLDQSVSAGIVSSLARNELMESTYGTTIYANLIQTDASINPGNSGGALVNSQGQLVGISTLFSSDTESFAGIGFAIPGNYALSIADKIIAGEQVTHAYIGLSMQTVTAQNASLNGLSVNQGAYVAEVAEGGPADLAGIQEGDIVISLGGTEISSADGMILAVRSHSTGETVEVTVMRGTQELTFDVLLGSDEALQALQQQQREEQQQQQGYPQDYEYGDGYGDGYTDRDVLEELYEYLYDNRGGSYNVGE